MSTTQVTVPVPKVKSEEIVDMIVQSTHYLMTRRFLGSENGDLLVEVSGFRLLEPLNDYFGFPYATPRGEMLPSQYAQLKMVAKAFFGEGRRGPFAFMALRCTFEDVEFEDYEFVAKWAELLDQESDSFRGELRELVAHSRYEEVLGRIVRENMLDAANVLFLHGFHFLKLCINAGLVYRIARDKLVFAQRANGTL